MRPAEKDIAESTGWNCVKSRAMPHVRVLASTRRWVVHSPGPPTVYSRSGRGEGGGDDR